MPKKFVICEINEHYLKNVKDQMKNQKMSLPKDESQITIAHKPIAIISPNELCDCKVCAKIKS